MGIELGGTLSSMARMPKTKRKIVRVGDQVGIEMAGRIRTATVIEDRGNLGVGGKRVVRIDVETDPSTDHYRVEVPVDWLKPAPA